jgi:hypothetical protein
MKAYPTFYLSSTLDDLRPEREAVTEALAGAYAASESYHADERGLIESALDEVASSRIYVGIVGLRYGFIPPGGNQSITELEYERAFEAGVPRFVFIKKPDNIFVGQADADRTRIDAFRARVSSGSPGDPRPAFFDGVGDLPIKVLKAIFDWRSRQEWSEPDSDPDSDQAEWAVAARPTPPPPRCVGRETPRRSIVQALSGEADRSALLLGPAGIGKTTLALVGLHDAALVARFGQRRYFTRCEGLGSRASVAGAIGASMGLRVARAIERTVLRELSEAPALVVLDGLETAWSQDTAAVEELLALVAGTPGVAVLVTMRGSDAPGGLAWRQTIVVDPLDRPSAREAFLDVARNITADDRRVGPLVQVLGRVPLAIVLMAHQAQSEPDLRVLSRRWRKEKTAMLRRAGARDAVTSLDVSYEMALSDARVTADGRQLLAWLALFPRGMALEDLDALAPNRAAGALAALRGAALTSTEAERARVLSPLREYVAHTLTQPSDVATVVRYYATLVGPLTAQVGKGGGRTVSARIAREAGNIEWAIAKGLQLPDRGPVIDAAIQWAKVARLSDVASPSLAQHAARVAEADADRPRQAEGLLAVGNVLLVRSTPDRAAESYQHAATIFRDLRHERSEAKCQYGLAMADFNRGRDAEARAAFTAAGETFKRLEEARWQANCLMGLADVAWISDRDEARALFGRALALYTQDRDLLGQANCIRSIADLDVERADYDHEAAHRRYQEAAELYDRVGDMLGRANCTFGLAEIERDRSGDGAARPLYQQAQGVYRRLGYMRGEADCLFRLGDLARAARAADEADRQYRASQRLYRQLVWKLGDANTTLALSRLAFDAADDARAREGFDAARTQYAGLAEPNGEGECLLGLARLSARAGDRDAAARDFALALDRMRKAGDPYAIGLVYYFWADGSRDDRETHRAAARSAWRDVRRPQLVSRAAPDGITADAIDDLLSEPTGA